MTIHISVPELLHVYCWTDRMDSMILVGTLHRCEVLETCTHHAFVVCDTIHDNENWRRMFLVTYSYYKIEYDISSFVFITLAQHKRKTKLGPGIV